MDPATAGFNTATAIVALLTKVWDAAPEPAKALAAADVAKTLHNCSLFLQSVQANLNAAVTPKP